MGRWSDLRSRVSSWLGGAVPARAAMAGGLDFDLPLAFVEPTGTPSRAERRVEASAKVAHRRAQSREALGVGTVFGLDADDWEYRRITSGAKFQRRDLTPLQQDRMLEVTWYLWEQNPFARRLIGLMTDLIIGEGVVVDATDDRLKEQIAKTWAHPSNVLDLRMREFYAFLSLTGELILPVSVNPVTGRPVLGFIDPYQVKEIIPAGNNVLMPDRLILKSEKGTTQPGAEYQIIRVNPATDRLEGDCFYFRINGLPNSLRGRSDLLALADWLDLYDQYMFAEVERLNLLSNFVWDYKIEGATPEVIAEKLKSFPTPKPGSLFAHNEKEELEPRVPDLKATDRSEVARLLRTHIAGAMGFPLSYMGEVDSNNATIQGQNDVMMKTPAARQKEFGAIIGIIAQFIIESSTGANPGLFRDADENFEVRMPEIQAKDIARVGQVMSAVATANDVSMQNGTMSKRGAATIYTMVVKQLGVDLDVDQILKEAEAEAEEREEKADEMQAAMMAAASRGGGNPPSGGGRPPRARRSNPPPEQDADVDRAA